MLLFFYCFRSSLYIKKTSYLLHFLANTFPNFFICFDFMIFFLDYEGFPDSSAGKESTCDGDPGLISGLGRSAGEGKGYPLQYSGLEKSMDCIVHGVAKSWTRLNDFHYKENFIFV